MILICMWILQWQVICVACLVWGHHDVFGFFLLGWLASPKKDLSRNGLVARVLGAKWGQRAEQRASALITV